LQQRGAQHTLPQRRIRWPVIGRPSEHQGEGDASKLPRLAAEIVAAHPDVIACTGTPEAGALRAATTDIPIVFHFIPDPLALGIVTSLARPRRQI
jgi:putative ABC transport system substrate-binding protein